MTRYYKNINNKLRLVVSFKKTLKIGGLTFFFEESGDGNPGGLLPHLGGDFLRFFFFVHVIIFRLIHLFTVFNSKCLNISDRRCACLVGFFYFANLERKTTEPQRTSKQSTKRIGKRLNCTHYDL